jgi:uncharacterized repeat protein (TIGR03803 family)
MRRIRVLVSALTLQSALLLLRGQSPVIYSFGGDPDGANPKRSVTLSGSSLYGTTVYGGSGDGTVFQLLSSSGSWSETVLYSFARRLRRRLRARREPGDQRLFALRHHL